MRRRDGRPLAVLPDLWAGRQLAARSTIALHRRVQVSEERHPPSWRGPEGTAMSIEVGELIKVLKVDGAGLDGTRAGYNEVYWDAKDTFDSVLSNGIYLYVIAIEGSSSETSAKGKMVILRR